MFGKKKPLVNAVFGEMIYWTIEWKAKFKTSITLWNKSYKIDLCAVASTQKDGISKTQENAYSYFKENIVDLQKQIEKLVSNYFQTTNEQTLIEKFLPTELQISLKGECAIIAENADDEDMHDVNSGLAVLVYPDFKVVDGERYSGYIFGSGDI